MERYCYQCPHSHYVDTHSVNFHNRALSGERIALYCPRLSLNLHIHTHCPPECMADGENQNQSNPRLL